jgi:signal transduction histidine kinase
VAAFTLRRAPRFGFGARRGGPEVPVAAAASAAWLLVGTVVVSSDATDDGGVALLFEAVVAGVPAAAGLYALRRERTTRFGYVLLALAVVCLLGALGRSADSLIYSFGRVVAWFTVPLLVYATVTFPDGRIERRFDRRLVEAVTLVTLVLFVGSAPFVEAFPVGSPWASCRAACPPNAFLVVDAEPAIVHTLIEPLREALVVLLVAAAAFSPFARMQGANRYRRSMLAPAVAMSALGAVALAVYAVARWRGADPDTVQTLGVVWSLSVPGIAAAFAVALLRHRLLVAGALARLSHALAHVSGLRGLRTALATALDDPTLEMLYPAEAPGRWRDARGRLVSPVAFRRDRRGVSRISDDDGRPMAAIVHDAALGYDEELLDAVGALVLSSLQRQRLTGRLATSLAELDESRKRIASVADRERSRIERDLHDGAQQRLILLRVRLSLAEELMRTDPAACADILAELGEEVDGTLDDLRSLAHGVYPSVLSDRGVEDALRSLAISSPLPVRLEIRGLTRHPPEIETAVYFTCVEAVQNAHKHAGGAARVWIRLRQDDALRLEVGDDGPGFEPGADGAGGLQNMRDRIEAVGGRLIVDSAPGHGTRIRGVVPFG